MTLSTTNLLAAIVSTRLTAYSGGLGRLGIDHSCAGLRVSARPHPQAFTQSCVEPLEGSIYAPSPKPPVDGLPRREVAGQKPPSTATPQDVEESVKDLAEAVDSRSSSPFWGREVGLEVVPFSVGKVGGVALSHALERTRSLCSGAF